ncbi:hypothetical protein OEW28_10465 [Defluviimonas sp. WL0002]|uniref:Uncharacterized protein n=1 Tax=Albidovulum marisflavi TaxID=2984159 RepID=A0ABT2ZD24_9RHOB|nr:hypothetical protein [Defluviimonas sp. WL0002]MCV2869048.1 hypothetical protein [Defluviimonas sp. WL0002]
MVSALTPDVIAAGVTAPVMFPKGIASVTADLGRDHLADTQMKGRAKSA